MNQITTLTELQIISGSEDKLADLLVSLLELGIISDIPSYALPPICDDPFTCHPSGYVAIIYVDLKNLVFNANEYIKEKLALTYTDGSQPFDKGSAHENRIWLNDSGEYLLSTNLLGDWTPTRCIDLDFY